MRVRDASPAQLRFWLLGRLAGGEAALMTPALVRLDGRLDLDRLAGALRGVIARHEVLRSSYRWEGDRLVAHVHDLDAIEVPQVGSRAQRTVDEAGAVRHAQELVAGPVDVAVGPLLRATLIAAGPDTSYLALAAHHIVWDGWSTALLLRELDRLYAGDGEALAALPASYWDYAAQQREAAREARGARDLAYWRRRLAELEAPRPLARPAGDDERAPALRNAAVALGAELVEQVAAFARACGATPFSVYLASLEAALHRSGLGHRPSIGLALVDRPAARFEPLLGCFVNTVVLHTTVADADAFEQLTVRARDATFEAIAHSAMPFEAMVEGLDAAFDPRGAPLYQALCSFQSFPRAQRTLGGARVASLPVPLLHGRTEPVLTVALELDEPELRVEWNGPLAIPPEQLLGSWRAFLDRGIREPRTRLDRLALGIDRAGARAAAGAVDRPAVPPETVPGALWERAVETPHAPALIDAEGELSFAELRHEAGTIAARLRGAGVGPGVAVALAARRSARTFAAMLGILEAGGACVPLDTAYPRERLRFMLSDSGASILVSDDPDARAWAGVSTLALDAREGVPKPATWAGEAGPQVQPVELASAGGSAPLDGEVAWVYYTSGSTGRPKGVLIPHRMAIARALREPIPWQSGDRCAQKSSLSFMDSIWELLGPLLHGLPTVIADDEAARDPRLLSRLIERDRVTRILLVPSLLGALLSLPEEDLARLRGVRHWIASGEVLPAALAERLYRALPDATLVNVYGATECWDACWHPVPRSVRAADAMPIGSRLLDDARVWVLDEELRPVAPGEAGELVVGGPCLALGYHARPELTAARFVSLDPAVEGGQRGYRTGDVVRHHRDGTLELLGRRDLQVKLHGFRIELEEVERWLIAAPGVAEGAVIARRDGAGTVEGLTAFVVPVPGAQPDPQRLREALGEQLPEHALPSGWLRLRSLPLMPNGKLDRAALELLAAHAPDALAPAGPANGGVEPRSELERTVAAIWRELLGVEHIAVTDDFFALGGSSLLAVQVVIKLQEQLAAEVPLRAFYARPTIAALSELLAG